MSYFQVDFDKIQDIIERQKNIRKALDESADELLASSLRVAGIGDTLRNKGYGGKVWNAYSEISGRGANISNSRKKLGRVHDIFLKYEKLVLQNAEEDITVKNGFTKTASQKAKKAADSAENKEKKEKQTKKKTFKSVFLSAIEDTKEGYKDYGQFFKDFKEYRSTAGKQEVEEFYHDLENFGVPLIVIGGIRLFEKKVGSTYEAYEDIFVWTSDPLDPTKRAKGIKGFLTLIDPSGIYTKPIKEKVEFSAVTAETLEKEGYRERGKQYQKDIIEDITEGNYGEAAKTAGEYILEVPKAAYDVGISYGKKKIDKVLQKTTWVSGDIWTVDELMKEWNGGSK